jgi:hypothetical protein
VDRRDRQQGQDEQDGSDQLHTHAVVVLMDAGASLTAGRAATLRNRPGTLCANQVLTAHLAPTGLKASPGHFDDVGRS